MPNANVIKLANAYRDRWRSDAAGCGEWFAAILANIDQTGADDQLKRIQKIWRGENKRSPDERSEIRGMSRRL
jgi:hypothetical protein